MNEKYWREMVLRCTLVELALKSEFVVNIMFRHLNYD